MKVLVYGAGVLGSYLAHVLTRGNNEVTLLARGVRYDELVQNGLVIRHTLQVKTTRDTVKLVVDLKPDDIYDTVFVVMQFTQLTDVLPILAANQSKLFVFVGNNTAPSSVKAALCGNSDEKTVLFGFQATGGRREKGRVVSIHAGIKMPVGTLCGEDFSLQQTMLKEAFAGTGHRLIFRNDMEAYLISHIAFVMPIAYACYATGGNLKKADKALLNQVIDATLEGYDVLEKNGISVTPAKDRDYVRNKRGSYYRVLYICAKTFIGRLAASEHAMHAVSEMAALSDAFDVLKKQAAIPTPQWDALEKHLQSMRGKLHENSKRGKIT
jgi:2-dehydropantoate 2-reductase